MSATGLPLLFGGGSGNPCVARKDACTLGGTRIQPLDISVGGWGIVNPGADPFGKPVRAISMEVALDVLGEVPGIKYVSFHDEDLWKPEAPRDEVIVRINEVREQVGRAGKKAYNFTANTFSDSGFRSGALSSPYPEVRRAALAKCMFSMDCAHMMGARNVIWWGGREGDDGAFAQDPGVGLRMYMEGVRACVQYALAQGYTFKHALEPKVYEPRLAGLYISTGAVAAAAILHYFQAPQFAGLIGVNPEYPQHTQMLGLPPVMELGMLMELGKLADFIHFGGQIPARTDCDLPPGWGGSIYDDFMLCLMLHQRGWRGVVEFDCRPARTTTTVRGLSRFLQNAVDYWRSLERKVEVYLDDPVIQELEGELGDSITPEAPTDPTEMVVWSGNLTGGRLDALQVARAVNTDAIEAYQARVLKIVMGVV